MYFLAFTKNMKIVKNSSGSNNFIKRRERITVSCFKEISDFLINQFLTFRLPKKLH